MTGHRPRCVATARPNAPHISGLVPNDAQLSGTPDLQFRTIAAMVAHARHEGENTANAVGWQHPPGFKSPILRSGLPTELPVSYRQNCGGGLFLSMAPGSDTGAGRRAARFKVLVAWLGRWWRVWGVPVWPG